MANPVVLVVDDEPANRIFAARMLAATWDVVEAADGEEAVSLAISRLPNLIVMDIVMPKLDGWAATARIRASDAPLSTIPIIAYTMHQIEKANLLSAGMDGHVPKKGDPDALIAAVARWRPDDEMAGAQRLADTFGQAEISELIDRFREQLVDAIAALDAEADDVPAHNIAGVAGTLGFAEVSTSWLRLSHGDESVREDARRDARLVITGIDRQRCGAG